jgi:serine protease Do
VVLETWDGKVVSGSVLRFDSSRDLALIATRATDAPPVPLADSQTLRAGTPVVAIGNPFGFIGALSSGVIHSIGRFQIGPGEPLEWVAADLRLGPGNSGGPLADFRGQLIGVNTMITSGHLALAIPSRAVQRFLRRSQAGKLGVTVRRVIPAKGEPGMMILEISPGGAAEAASLFPGDILTAVNDRPAHFASDLQDAIDDATDGFLRIQFRRGMQSDIRQVAIALRPEGQRSAA